jgi:hypothetical protein
MKTEEAKLKIIAFLQTVSETTVQDICYKTAVPMVQIHGIVTLLNDKGAITVDVREKKKFITFVDLDKANLILSDVVKIEAENVVVKKNKETSIAPATLGKRDFTKYSLKGHKGLYSKGRLCLAIITQYILDNPNTTLIDLHQKFPLELIKPFNYGLIKPVDEAKKINNENGKRKRFFSSDEEVIKLLDVDVCVTNQITSSILNRFLMVASDLGYKAIANSVK